MGGPFFALAAGNAVSGGVAANPVAFTGTVTRMITRSAGPRDLVEDPQDHAITETGGL